MTKHTVPKHPTFVGQYADMRDMLKEFVDWDPGLHYERSLVSGDHDDGPYIEADHFLALQRRAKIVIGAK